MSALGQKQTLHQVRVMSALPPKADIAECYRDVRFVPKIPALLVFVIGFGLYMLVHAAGLLPSIPDRYVLWALLVIAIAIPGVMWVRYIALVVRNE